MAALKGLLVRASENVAGALAVAELSEEVLARCHRCRAVVVHSRNVLPSLCSVPWRTGESGLPGADPRVHGGAREKLLPVSRF